MTDPPRFTIDIKLTKKSSWENLGIFTPSPSNCWDFLDSLRRLSGLYPDYYAAQVRHESDRP